MRCAASDEVPELGQIPRKFRVLASLHEKLRPPQPGDWLSMHNEPGQTYLQYVRSRPVRPDRRRRVIYVQPLGKFDQVQAKLVERTAEFLGLYFGLTVRMREPLGLEIIPDHARRTHPTWGDKQILSTYVLSDVLRPRLPRDATAYIALTASDLWPGEGWNFVFGQASLAERVGVWSIYRNGNPHEGDEAYRTCLRRTLKTASHETGHMFSMAHCTFYECNMCGSNHRAEADRRPLALCPICLAKLCWATRAEPEERFERLADFCDEAGLKPEAALYRKSCEAMQGP